MLAGKEQPLEYSTTQQVESRLCAFMSMSLEGISHLPRFTAREGRGRKGR